MFEKFQNKVEKKSEGISLKDKALKVISDTTKIATLISLFSIPLNNEASASSLNEKDPVNLKNKIELAQESIKKINVVLEEKCKGSTHTLGGQEIRSFKLTKGTEVTSANNGDWFILMNKDGSNVFCDYDQDGSVDRFIINNQDEENKLWGHYQNKVKDEDNPKIPRIPQHGDLTLDNIFIDKNGVHIFDCERFGDIDIAGFDIFHLLYRVSKHNSASKQLVFIYFLQEFLIKKKIWHKKLNASIIIKSIDDEIITIY